jgi:hypothetical protein
MLRHRGALPPRELNVAAFGYGQVPMTATGGPAARRDPPALTLGWRHEVRGRTLRVSIEPFGKLTARTRQAVGCGYRCAPAVLGL